MYWLKEQNFRQCRNGAFVGSANSTRQRWGCFSIEIQRANFFHIFGNNLKIRPVRPIKMAPLLMETFHMTPYWQKSAQRSRRRSPDKTREKKEKDKDKEEKKNK